MQTDASLATAATFGDRGAFEELYTRYSSSLIGFVTRLTGDRFLAEDIAQDTFLTAWRDLSELRDPAVVRAWLFSIAYRRSMDHLRRPATMALADLPDLPDPAPGTSPDSVAERREAASLVWAAASGLEPRQRAVLELSVRWELSSAEIGEVLGVGRAHAAVLVHRTRSALGNAVRTLLVARQRDRCGSLDALTVGFGPRLSGRQRSSVDHHIRRCPACRLLGARVGAGTLLVLLYAAADQALADRGPAPVLTAAHIPAPRAPEPDPAPGRHVNPRRVRILVPAVALIVLFAGGTAGGYALWTAGPKPAVDGISEPLPPAAAASPLLSALVPTPSPSPSPAASASASPSKSPSPKASPKATPAGNTGPEAEVLALVNQRRAEAGCGPLHYDAKLAKAAYDHSADMAARNYFAHDTPEGVTPWDRAKAAGYNDPSAENIAAGNATAEATMTQWMNSPGHKANILNCESKALGVGRATGGSYRYYWTQLFGYK